MKKLIIILLFLLILPMAFAAKVTQTFVGGDEGLEIRIPQAEFIKQNTDAQLNLHVFNKSNGILVDNTTTECLIHIFNKTGNHVFDEHLDFDNGNHGSKDFTIDISGGNFTELGFHSFIVQCNTSSEGGFVSGSFRVTETGEEEGTTAESIKLMATLLGILILVSLFIILTFSLGEEHYILKLFFMLMALITILVIPQLIIKGVSSGEANILNITLWVFRIFVIYVSVYVIYNWARSSERFLRWFGSQK